jgi:hypothetical protein
MDENWNTDVLDKEGTFSNFTEDSILTCAASNIQGSIELPYPLSLTITVRVIEGLYSLIIILAGLILNTLVIVLVARHKKLQTMSFMIAVQIVVLGLVLSVTISTGLLTTIANKWLLGEYVCAINGMLISITAIARTLLMCVFVVDRFLAVFRPYAYPKYKLKVTVTLSAASWVYAVLGSVAMLPGLLDCYRFTPILKTCGFSSSCSQNCSVYVRAFTVSTIPFMILSVVLYAILYNKTRKIRKADDAAHAAKTYHKEWKATITFSLLFTTLFAVTVPTMIISSIILALSPSGELSPAAYIIRLICYHVVTLLIAMDPIVIMRHQDVREIISTCFKASQTHERHTIALNEATSRNNTKNSYQTNERCMTV